MNIGWTKIGAIAAISLLIGAPTWGDDKDRTISVNGSGSVRARPDLAIIDLGVTVWNEAAATAMANSREKLALVLKVLTEAGIDSKDIVTSDFSIRRENVRPEIRSSSAVERFVVRNLVQVTVRDIDLAGHLIDELIESGANEVRGIRFALQDDAEVSSQARELAAADARTKAQHLATLHKARLGPVLRISESGMHGGRAEAMMMRAMDSSSPTISAGELTFGTQLQVVYLLKE